MWKLWRIGTVFGVPLMMHGTFVLLLAFYAISGLAQGGAAGALLNLALGITVFAVVVLHELGHIAAYRHYGIKAKDIILSPMGGIARGIAGPGGGGAFQKPKQELVIAAAGPAVNLVLAGLTYAAIRLAPWTALGDSAVVVWSLAKWFLTMNVFLLVFNLIPALPMDGGRMLRAVLTGKMGFLKATQVAARVARWATLAMAIYGVATGNFTLLLVAGAVYVMSWMELAQAHASQVTNNPLFRIFGGGAPGAGFPGGGFPGGGFQRGGFSGGGAGGPAGGVVDQYGNPVGGGGGAGWSSAEHVRPTPDGQGWTVKSVRWLED